MDTVDAYLSGLPAGLQSRQLEVMNFNTDLQQHGSVAQPGYVASVDDPASRTVTLYLSGRAKLSAEARSLARKYHVTLKSRQWAYSSKQLESAATDLINSASHGHISGLAARSATTFDPSFAGVTLEGTATRPASTKAATRWAQQHSSVATRIKNVRTGPAASRDSDYAPYNAGDMMFGFDSTGHSHFCTTGFAVHYLGHNYTTTAQHCRLNTYRTLNSEYYTFGATEKYSSTGQARMMTKSGSKIMWTGPWSGGSARTVIGAKAVSIGDKVCTSGANSGTHCGVTVTAQGSFYDGYSTEPVLAAFASSGIAAIQGDSGGPVYVPVSGTTNVYAVGMMQQYRGKVLNPNCGNVYQEAGNYCTNGMAFTPIKNVLSGLQATLVTG